MAPRAYWKGHIRLALVSFPVRLYAAVTQTERIALHRIHRDTGERVRMQNVVPDEGPVEKSDIVMGYEYERDHYVPVTEEELDGLQVESKHTIDLSRFVDLAAIDPIYFDKPYFVAPDGDIATEAFVTIRDALRSAKKVALGQIVLSKRERVVAIQPCGDGMVLETLRWAEEVREAGAYFDSIEDVKVSADQVEMAEMLIKARSGAFEPETFVDQYQKALRELIQAKLKGKEPSFAKPRQPKSNVINLMDALKKSLGDGAAKGGAKDSGAKESGAKDSGSKAAAKAADDEKPAAKPAARRTRAAKADEPKKAAPKAAPKARQRKSA